MATHGVEGGNPIDGDHGVVGLWAAVKEMQQRFAQIRDLLIETHLITVHKLTEFVPKDLPWANLQMEDVISHLAINSIAMMTLKKKITRESDLHNPCNDERNKMTIDWKQSYPISKETCI